MMKRFSRMFVVVSIFCFPLAFITSVAPAAFAQKEEPSKAAAKKQAAAQPSEKPAESAIRPEPPAEQRPSVRETPADKEKEKEEHYDMTEAASTVTHHQTTVDGKLLKYSATAGRLPIKRGDGRIEAEMFYVAYTLDGQDAAKRPLTFALNGGPGAALVWL